MTTGPTDPARLRPAGRATRDAIEAAARDLFARSGYDGTSVRSIAQAADADPALVIRHFGSKERLFLHVIDDSESLSAVIAGPLESLGRRLVGYFLSEDAARTRDTFGMLSRAAHHATIREELVRRTRDVFVEPLAERLDCGHREERMAMVLAQLNGLLTALFVYEQPELLEGDHEFVVNAFGAAIQLILTPTSS